MASEEKILSGEFKGIQIRINSGSVVGGRKNAKKEFPNRDTQTIEDLGLLPRTYQLEILISDIGKTEVNQEPQQEYFDYRDSLIAAIEDKGTGVLIHPLNNYSFPIISKQQKLVSLLTSHIPIKNLQYLRLPSPLPTTYCFFHIENTFPSCFRIVYRVYFWLHPL